MNLREKELWKIKYEATYGSLCGTGFGRHYGLTYRNRQQNKYVLILYETTEGTDAVGQIECLSVHTICIYYLVRTSQRKLCDVKRTTMNKWSRLSG